LEDRIEKLDCVNTLKVNRKNKWHPPSGECHSKNQKPTLIPQGIIFPSSKTIN